MATRHVIYRKTPFPGTWLPMSVWQLQYGEYALKLNRRYYHDCAVKVRRNVFAYTEQDAQAIVDHWQQQYPFAEYRLEEIITDE